VRNDATSKSPSNIVVLSDIRRGRRRASSDFGPVRAGLIPTHGQGTTTADPLAQLSVLLSSLESAVESLNSKSYAVLDTLTTAIAGARAALSHTQTDEAGTDG
jgi:hypothetical protein